MSIKAREKEGNTPSGDWPKLFVQSNDPDQMGDPEAEIDLTHEGQDHGTPDGLTDTDTLSRYREGIMGEVMRYLTDYVVMPGLTPVVTAAWILASWHSRAWDYFPILAITSPEMRCGKSTLLDLIGKITPNSTFVPNLSSAALYRTMGDGKIHTLLLDEAQILNRKRSEQGESLKEILCASVRKDGKVRRCIRDGRDFELKDFNTFGPKVLACIGKIDPVLADRCLPIELQRKLESDVVNHAREREIIPRGNALKETISAWHKDCSDTMPMLYERTEYLNISNDRMADGLLPLLTVLRELDLDNSVLVSYAERIEGENAKAIFLSSNNRMLASCRELFYESGSAFIESTSLVAKLNTREEDPWLTWNNGVGINTHNLARLLDQYGIKPRPNSKGTKRGYYRDSFEAAWKRYLPSVTSSYTSTDRQCLSERQTPEEDEV